MVNDLWNNIEDISSKSYQPEGQKMKLDWHFELN